jgi:hypothetical protein
LTFAPPSIGPAQLAEASGAGHQVAKLRILSEAGLQLSVLIVVQILGNVTSECRGFDEYHGRTPLAYPKYTLIAK